MAGDITINTYHDSNFKITVSNVPGMTLDQLYLIDNFIKGIDIPGFSLNAYQEFIDQDQMVVHPLQHRQADLGEVTLTMKITENLLNYLYLMRYMQTLKYGIKDSVIPGEEIVSDKINKISIDFLDNQQRVIANYSFNGCMPTQISNIPLIYGSNNEITFSLTLRVESVDIDIKTLS